MATQTKIPSLIFTSLFACGWMTTPSAFGQCVATEAHTLVAPDAGTDDEYGWSVSLGGSVAVVGARRHDGLADDEGAAYVYRLVNGAWSHEETFTSQVGDRQDFFGGAVATDGTVIAIGAPQEEAGGFRRGAVDVYRYDGSTWNFETVLTASDGEDADVFGYSLAVDGDWIVVGAPDDDDAGNSSGSAYAFFFDGTSWSQVQKLTSNQADAGDKFGESVAIDGTTILVGSHLDDEDIFNGGAAYLYDWDGSTWSLTQRLAPNAPIGSLQFGLSVDIDNGAAIIGTWAVSAYTFRFDGSSWVEEQTLVSSDYQVTDQYAWDVAISGDFAVVTAHRVDEGASFDAGASYVFRHDGDLWLELNKQRTTTHAPLDWLGYSVAIDGQTLLASAPYHDASGAIDAGAAFIYDIPDLGLDVRPNDPSLGSPIQFQTCGGSPGELTILFATEVNGIPATNQAASGAFDVLGSWVVDTAVPVDPALAGLVITLESFTLLASGLVVGSNQEVVSIQ